MMFSYGSNNNFNNQSQYDQDRYYSSQNHNPDEIIYPIEESGSENTKDSLPGAFDLTDLIQQKSQLVDSKIQMIVTDIYQRYRLKNDNLYRIYLDQCACRNLAHHLDETLWDRQRLDLEKKMIDLERDLRQEKLWYFRDILFLKKELRESCIERMEEQNKTKMILGNTEEHHEKY